MLLSGGVISVGGMRNMIWLSHNQIVLSKTIKRPLMGVLLKLKLTILSNTILILCNF
ncbi:hypothetical protein TUM2330_45210 (plasmid) [Escherichia coli]|nr:hypothetical protein TUM2330_45210 [Escherichia coli]